MIGMVLDRMEQGQTLPDLQTVVYGASPIAEALLRRAMTVFANTRFFQVYGQTELSPAATLLSHEDHILEGPLARRLKSAGQAIPCCDVEVTDEAGRPLPQGCVGEIRVRGPNVMLGYWNLPQQTAETLVNGWCRTGDAGFFDEDRYLYVVDRVKDMIVSGGENVYSA
jgi:acyl-CoA synthetase (AMP-forming)/AMP-acid ligase II